MRSFREDNAWNRNKKTLLGCNKTCLQISDKNPNTTVWTVKDFRITKQATAYSQHALHTNSLRTVKTTKNLYLDV
jgi:hypothetical protein